MCGILGGVNARFDDAAVRRLAHRGPDQSDLWVERSDDRHEITLGQTRLSIVDRHDIDLPVRHGSASIAFNGEIFNWRTLRSELEGAGWEFATATDIEVALIGYLHWGPDCVRRFNGQFAFAIWDGSRLFCARDRMGQKPFFYRVSSGVFEFASEVKAFEDVEFVRNDLFELFEFCHGQHTLFEGVLQLQPGHHLSYHPENGNLATASYWDIPEQVDPAVTDPDHAVATFVELLEDSVALRMQADVPITMLLSGGLDSTLIASLAGVDEAFTCDFVEFRDTINEAHYASDFAERAGIGLNVVTPTRDEFTADLPALAYHLEMPTGSFSVVPLYRLAKAVHEAGYKVALSGEGSDELFGGYVRNEFLMLDRSARWSGIKAEQYGSMLGRFAGSDLDRFCRMASRSGLEGAAAMKGYLQHLWNERKSMLANMCYVEARIFLQPLLQMADRMSMANSVEMRNPFLDHRLVEFAFGLADDLRFREGTGKWIVVEAARRVLPKGSATLERGVKHGLPAPINLWLQGHQSFDRSYWNALLTAECIKQLAPSRRV